MEALVIFSDPNNRFGISEGERIPPSADTAETYRGGALKKRTEGKKKTCVVSRKSPGDATFQSDLKQPHYQRAFTPHKQYGDMLFFLFISIFEYASTAGFRRVGSGLENQLLAKKKCSTSRSFSRSSSWQRRTVDVSSTFWSRQSAAHCSSSLGDQTPTRRTAQLSATQWLLLC